MATTTIIIAVIVSAVTGTVASIVAPWANWGVEKKKKKLLWRKGFINDCKRVVDKNRFSLGRFREAALYSNLKIHLSDKLQKDIREIIYPRQRRLSLNEELDIVRKEVTIKNNLFNEIDILERKWGLL